MFRIFLRGEVLYMQLSASYLVMIELYDDDGGDELVLRKQPS